MTQFLLVYDRAAGQLLRTQAFADRAEAMQARFDAELELSDRPDVEIVALEAASEEELMRTHARYFLGLPELADRLADPAWQS